MQRSAARLILQQRKNITATIAENFSSSSSNSSSSGFPNLPTPNNIFDTVKEGVKQTMDVVSDTCKNISQTTITLSSQGIEIKNPAMDEFIKDIKHENDAKDDPSKFPHIAAESSRVDIIHEKELKAASKTAQDIDEADRLLRESKTF